MSSKKFLLSKMPLALIVVLLVSVVYPSTAQANQDDNRNSISAPHNTPSIVFAQELEEDERADQEFQLFQIAAYSYSPQIQVSFSTVFAQQAETLFLVHLFSNISTQAP